MLRIGQDLQKAFNVRSDGKRRKSFDYREQLGVGILHTARKNLNQNRKRKLFRVLILEVNMPPIFRNSSSGSLTRAQAVALMKERQAAQNSGAPSHDVSNEPRIPKGSGQESGEWTKDGATSKTGGEREISTRCPKGYDIVPMEVTGYTDGPESTGKHPGDPGYGQASSGAKTRSGTFAAPPGYKFGTRMYVPGFGWGTVQDRGSAIHNNKLDIWFKTVAEAKKWGRRKNVNVIICKG